MSYVLPLVTWTLLPDSASFINRRIRSFGFGVVVTTACGVSPRRRPNCIMSQVSSSYCQAASSSHHTRWNCGPRNRDGSSAEKPLIRASLNSVISLRLLLYFLIMAGGKMLMIPDSPSKQTPRMSDEVGAITPHLTSGFLAAYHAMSSAPVLVLPKPRPAKINHVNHDPCGVNCSRLAWLIHFSRHANMAKSSVFRLGSMVRICVSSACDKAPISSCQASQLQSLFDQ